MSFKAPVFTNKGKQLYASCLAGKNEIIFTNIKLGDGELMAQAIADLEDLINPVKTIVLNDKKLIGNDQVLIRAVFKNIDIDTGFYWREVGLYAQDPENPEDRSKDILFCYQNAGDTAEYIPSASSGLIDKILSMSLVVSDVNSVNVSFFSESYALKEDLDEQIALQAQNLDTHKTDANAHGNLAHYTDINAHSNLFGDVVLYVNGSSGSDDNDGLTSVKAKQTINGAISAIPPACRLANIIISEGTYNEDIDISYSRCGTLTLEGVEGETVTVQSILACSLDYFSVKNITITGNTKESASVVIYTSNFRLDGVTITNGADIENGVIAQYGAGLITNCNISGFDKGVHGAYGASVEVRTSTFENNTVDLYAYGAQIYIDNDNFTRDSVAGGSVICGSVGKALTLGGLVRSVNGVDADVDGNVTIDGSISESGSNYIKFTNGLKICWGDIKKTNRGEYVTNNFPIAFTVKPSIALGGEYSYGGYDNAMTTITNTGFTATYPNQNMIFKYIAIGY